MSGISLQEVGGDLIIDVPEEQTLIGRGQFLQVTDKRVSRSHAILEVIDRKLYITPNHTNPCFLRTQGAESSSVLPKDVRQALHHGDSFGLLPDQFYYEVSYPQVNGKDRVLEDADIKSNDIKEEKNEVAAGEKHDNFSKKENGTNGDKGDENWDKAADNDTSPKPGIAQDSKAAQNIREKNEKRKEVKFKHGNVALPLNKKRPLPAWMLKMASSSPAKVLTPAKKPKSTAVNKRTPGQKLTVTKEYDDDEEESYDSKKYVKGRPRPDDDDDEEEDFDDNISDDDYVPETIPKRGGAKRKRKYSESDNDDFSEDDDDDDDEDYRVSKKRKPKTPKKSPKGRGKKVRKKQKATTSSRKTPQRRVKKNQSDDDYDDENISLPRRGDFDDDDDDDDDITSRRPQRAARQKRGSYVDDPMIEEALEDFASDNDEVNEEKDSDFEVEAAYESGSDFEKKKKHSQKQKVQKPGRPRASPRGPTKKGKKKAPRRPSKTNTYSDDDDADVLEDDEPYVPRPSKRRGGGVTQRSDESEDEKKRRRREPCQYGEKCYRKNPVHFRTYCHPGDSSYDEDEDKPTSRDSVKKDRDSGKTSAEKPSRPQRSTAGTRLVTQGSVVDDDLPDTYDYNDSFIDDGTQPSDDSAKDSDYDAEGDVRGLSRDAKKFIKNKKMARPVN